MRRLCSPFVVCAALVAALTLTAVPALASDGVEVTKAGGGELVVTISTEAANVHFNYNPSGCGSNVPCMEITAGQGMVGTPVSANGGCEAKVGNAYTPSAIVCPASGVSSVTFAFKNGGTWSAYAGGGGQHAGGPCSPVPVTVKTGPGGGAISVNAWNGCPESVVCDSPPSVFSAVESDAADMIKGKCSSMLRH